MSEIATAPVVGATAGGFLVGVTEGVADGAPDPAAFRRLPLSVVAEAAAKAATALQPADVGTAAALSVEEVQGLVTAQLGDTESAVAAILAVIG